MASRTVEGLGLFAALQATFADVHPFCDQFVQNSADAAGKGQPGREGAKHCARHVATYTTGQTVAAATVTRALGYRIGWRPLVAGMAVNAVTHYVLDRRAPLRRLCEATGRGGYIAHATVQRRDGVVDESGPGTAFTELDQACHRLIGVAASLLTTRLALRTGRGSGDECPHRHHVSTRTGGALRQERPRRCGLPDQSEPDRKDTDGRAIGSAPLRADRVRTA